MPLTLDNTISRSALGTLNSRAMLGDVCAKRFIDYLNQLDLVKDYKEFSFAPAILRGYIYDRWIGDILNQYKNLRVLNLGCGFCTRYFYVNKENVVWTDADLPEIVALRRGFNLHELEGDNYKLLELDVNTMDLTLLTDNYDLVIAEGLLCYFPKARVLDLISHCKHIICDVIGDERKLELSITQQWKYSYEDFKHLPITREFRYTYYSRDDRVLEFKQV